MALERKQGVSNLELMCKELLEEERVKEQRQEKKRQKKKKKRAKSGQINEKENHNVNEDDDDERCSKVSCKCGWVIRSVKGDLMAVRDNFIISSL